MALFAAGITDGHYSWGYMSLCGDPTESPSEDLSLF